MLSTYVGQDTRSHVRVSLGLQVSFRWTDERGKHNVQGVTRDISANDMFIVSEVCPPECSIVRCELLVPWVEPPNSLLQGFAVGRVVRTESRTGFAILSKAFVLRFPQA